MTDIVTNIQLFGGRGASSGMGKNTDSESNYNAYLSTLSNMQQGRVSKTLGKRYKYDDKVLTEREFVESAVKNKLPIEEKIQVKSNLLQLKYSNKPKQFEYMKREEHLRQNQYIDFVKGNLNTPLANYFKSGNTADLTDKYISKTYTVAVKEHIGTIISKTAYDYSKYLMGSK